MPTDCSNFEYLVLLDQAFKNRRRDLMELLQSNRAIHKVAKLYLTQSMILAINPYKRCRGSKMVPKFKSKLTN